MIENHDFVDAYYVDNEKRVLETLWVETGTRNVREFVIDTEDDPEIYQQFIDMNIHVDGYKVSQQWLYERTYAHMKEQREAYEAALVESARANGHDLTEIFQKSIVDYDMLLNWLDETSDYDTSNKEVFKIKLRMFEQPHVLKSEDRELKSKMRKAKSRREIMLFYLQFPL